MISRLERIIENRNKMDRIRFVYKTDAEGDVELPFRVLVLGDYSGSVRKETTHEIKPIEVNKKNFNSVIKKLDVHLRFRVKDFLTHPACNPGFLDIDYPVMSLDDFSPDVISSRIAEIQKCISLRNSIGETTFQTQKDGTGLTEFEKSILPEPITTPDQAKTARAEILSRLNRQMDAIVHHPGFVRMEAAWRALWFLVNKADPGENCFVHLLDIQKDDLYEDFVFWGDITKSFFYKTVYTDEFGQYGGKPYGVIISTYFFDASFPDTKLLSSISNVCALCFTPFIGSLAPGFFGLSSMGEISRLQDIHETLENGFEYIKWREFRKTPESRFIGLVLPSFLMRPPYNFRTYPINRFPYTESPVGLWVSGAFAFCSCLIKSFIRSRWCLNIIGPEEGRVEGIRPVSNTRNSHDQIRIPTEVLIPEKTENALSESGFIPLMVHKGENYAAFYSANSVKAPDTPQNAWEKTMALNKLLEVQLPYTFVVSRIAHYLKVIQRDIIGSSKSAIEIEKELNFWLVQYVSDMENPSAAVRARRPLRRARIRVTEEKTQTEKTWFLIQLEVIPHFKYMGASFSLNLDGYLESGPSL